MIKGSECYRFVLGTIFQSFVCFSFFGGFPVLADAYLDSSPAIVQEGNISRLTETDIKCCAYNPLQYAYFDVGYSWGQFIGIDTDYAEFGLFLPFYLGNQWVFYTDLNGYNFNNKCGLGKEHPWGCSLGLGARKVICNGSIIGANVYYDDIEGRDDKFFHRIGVGLEYLASCWDARINGYFPVGSRTHNIGEFQTFTYTTGETIDIHQVDIRIDSGFDAELGTAIYTSSKFRLYGAAGPYGYAVKYNSNIYGGYGRLELDLGEYLVLQARTSYDKVYKSRTQFSAMLNIPFDILCCWDSCRDCCLNLLTQPVRRDGLIFFNNCNIYTNPSF